MALVHGVTRFDARLSEFLEEILLFAGQLGRNFDDHFDELITATIGT